MKPMPLLVAALAAAVVSQVCGPVEAGGATIRVRFSLDRPTYLLYEAVPARVIIENYSGRTIRVGTGAGATHPVSFLITNNEGLAVQRAAGAPAIEPLEIPHGREGDIVADLVHMYAMRTPGLYRVTAVIGERGQPVFAQSATVTIEVARGRTVWAQRVGVPGKGPDEKLQQRYYELLVNRVGPHDELFLRIQDEERRMVYGVHPLGVYLPFKKPEVRFDGMGYLHVMQQSTPRTYTYSVFSPYGARQTRAYYSDMVTIPRVQSDGRGNVMVIGGEEIGPDAPTDPDLRPEGERERPPEPPAAEPAESSAAGAVGDPGVSVPPADREPLAELMPEETTDPDMEGRPGPGDRVVPR